MPGQSAFITEKLSQIRDLQDRVKYLQKKQDEQINAKQAKEAEKANREQQRAVSKKVKEIAQARKHKKDYENSGTIQDYSFNPRSSSREKPLPSRPVNLEGKIPLRIDHRTVVYIRPDQDPAEVKAKYTGVALSKKDEQAFIIEGKKVDLPQSPDFEF